MIKKCGACHSDCETCSGADSDNCFTCPSGLVMVNSNSCYPYCPTGQLEIKGFCYACHPFCTQCFGVLQTECSGCSSNLVLFGTECAEGCPDGYKQANLGNSCIQCDATCTLCNVGGCTECVDGPYILIDGKCTEFTCGPG